MRLVKFLRCLHRPTLIHHAIGVDAQDIGFLGEVVDPGQTDQVATDIQKSCAYAPAAVSATAGD